MTGERLSSLSPKTIGKEILQKIQKLSIRKQATTTPPLSTPPSSFTMGREPTTPPLIYDGINFTMCKQETPVSTVVTLDTPPPTPGFQQLTWELPEQLPRMFLHSSNLTSFTLFPNLPKELRVKIWKFAALYPRIVHITYDHPSESLVSLTPAPALLATCGEARDELLPIFQRLKLPKSAVESVIYINLEIDTCYIRRAITSMEDASPYSANFTTNKAIFGNNDSKALHPLSAVKHLAIDASLVDSPIHFRLIWGDWDKNTKATDLKLQNLSTFQIVYTPVGPRPSLRKIRGHPRISYDDFEGFTVLSKEDRWERRRRRHLINNGEWMTESAFRAREFTYRQGVFVKQDPVFFDHTHTCEDMGMEADFYCAGCHVHMSLGAVQSYLNMMERDVVGWVKPEFEGIKFLREEERDTEYYLWA